MNKYKLWKSPEAEENLLIVSIIRGDVVVGYLNVIPVKPKLGGWMCTIDNMPTYFDSFYEMVDVLDRDISLGLNMSAVIH